MRLTIILFGFAELNSKEIIITVFYHEDFTESDFYLLKINEVLTSMVAEFAFKNKVGNYYLN